MKFTNLRNSIRAGAILACVGALLLGGSAIGAQAAPPTPYPDVSSKSTITTHEQRGSASYELADIRDGLLTRVR